ncbi:hypothetical protein SAMN04487965_0155 [Microbulbifer donghaiensis]|uniref:Uncharacterized protein n=1 Tax=Microbulbifer donghaiensis TaxID=494016 RepID=A0A1M4UGX2_9GAMM|nr:hypothetical protein [Microbulbifer donghaiensis]SHE55888.1 hypothetical protein SAMN04487965_0155 [Microbulbifer donghaiensis]
MKVGLVYIICFDGSDDTETRNARDGLIQKYKSKGLTGDNIVSVFIEQRTIYYQFILKNKGHKLSNSGIVTAAAKANLSEYANGVGDEPFTKLRAVHPVSIVGNGVGIYFLFHGTAGNADISANVTGYITSLLAQKHPGGLLRKINFVVCCFANNQAGRQRTSELLGKFANSVCQKVPATDRPKLAGYMGGVYVARDGKKYSDSSLSQPLKGQQGSKIIYVLDSKNQYERRVYSDNSGLWSDPVVTTVPGGHNVVTENDTV